MNYRFCMLISVFHFYEDYIAFKRGIDQCSITNAFIKDKEKKRGSLLTTNLQSFRNIKLLPV